MPESEHMNQGRQLIHTRGVLTANCPPKLGKFAFSNIRALQLMAKLLAVVTACNQTLRQETIYCLSETDTLSTDEMVNENLNQIDWKAVVRDLRDLDRLNQEFRRNTTYTEDFRNLGSALLALGYYTVFGGSMCFLLNVAGAVWRCLA